MTQPLSERQIRLVPYGDRPEVSQGDSGGAVQRVHYLLRQLGYRDVSGSDFDAATESAVTDFQTKNLRITRKGTVGSKTWKALEIAKALKTPPERRPVLIRGDLTESQHVWVGVAQSLLRDHGHDIADLRGFPFGPQTEAAIRGFQQAKGISVTGRVDAATWAALEGASVTPPTPKPPPTPPPTSTYNNTRSPIFGKDASDFDSVPLAAFPRMKSEGIDFFTHKLSEKYGNSTWVHRQCGPRMRAARDAGIPFLGVYIVPRSVRAGGSVAQQVDFALSELNKAVPWWKDFRGFFIQVDLEHWSYDKVPVSVGTAMSNLLESRTGKKVILYAPRWAYGNTIPAPWNARIWNSHYVSGSGPFRSLYPGNNHAGWRPMSGREPIVLQYSYSATAGGSRGGANAYKGTALSFAKLIGAA